MSIHRIVILQTTYGQKKFSTFSYKLVQISPIMILVNSGAFLSISSWFSLTELIFVMIPYISSTGYPPTTQRIMGHVQVANCGFRCCGTLIIITSMPKALCLQRIVSERIVVFMKIVKEQTVFRRCQFRRVDGGSVRNFVLVSSVHSKHTAATQASIYLI